MLNYFPQYFTQKAIILYFLTLLASVFLYLSHVMDWYNYVIGGIIVIMFFVGSNELTKRWIKFSPKSLTRNIFLIGFLVRVIWVLFTYFFYSSQNGVPFEFDSRDAQMYHGMATQVAQYGFGSFKTLLYGTDIDDQGYIAYLSAIYMVFGNSIIIARIIKAVLGAFTAVLVYKLASRTFGENVGRMAGILFMLMPDMIYYCGVHYKEIEMIFLTTAALERSDNAIRSPKFTFGNLIFPILFAGLLFTFRTALGLAVLGAFGAGLFFTSQRIGNMGKRIILIVWVGIIIAFFAGGKIATKVESMWATRGTAQQQSLEWRAKRGGGNSFATYAKPFLAPSIIVIPLPTVINITYHKNLQLANGGYFVKNLMAFFVILAFYYLVVDIFKKRGKKWRDFMLPGSFLIGYLLVIGFSQFAQSERFHMPAIPCFLMFAAYGISICKNRDKNYYMIYLMALFVSIIVFQWFKLAGRGMV